jgi:hypothetical protein
MKNRFFDMRHESKPRTALNPTAEKPKLRLIDQVRLTMRRLHYSETTEESYIGWIVVEPARR